MAKYVMHIGTKKAGRYKSAQAVVAAGRHTERKPGDKVKKRGNEKIEPERTHLNEQLLTVSGTLYERVKARIDSAVVRGKGVRSNSNLAVEVIFQAGSDDEPANLSPEALREFFRKCVEFAGREWGVSNLMSAVVHHDETTPHLHLILTPITFKEQVKEDDPTPGRLSARDLFGGQGKLKYQHDVFYKEVAKDYGLERNPEGMRDAPSLTVKEYKQAKQVAEQVKRVGAELSAVEAGRGEAEKKRVEAEKRLAETNKKIEQLEGRLKRIDNKTNETILEWIEKVKKETDVSKPILGGEPVAKLPLAVLNDVLKQLEKYIEYAEAVGDNVKNLEATVKRKDDIIKQYDKNWIPKDQLTAAGLTPERLTELAQARQQAKQKDLTKDRSPSRSLLD